MTLEHVKNELLIDEEDFLDEEKEFLSDEEKEKIAEENLALVYYVIKMFQNSGISYDELESIAMVGYAKAINSFDKNRNVKFSTYSINCIKNEILFFLRKEKKHLENSVSINGTLATDKNGNHLSIEDTLSNQNKYEKSLEDQIMLDDDVEMLKEALSSLTEKERYIVIYRYGLDRGIIKTQREIAETIGMSQANVSKIEKTILNKLKKVLKKEYKMVTDQYE